VTEVTAGVPGLAYLKNEDLMNSVAEKHVSEIAVEQPTAVRVFEKFGIDYCCGGRKPLAQACGELQLSLEQVIEKLAAAAAQPLSAEDIAWQDRPLRELIGHIVSVHHAYVRNEIPRLIFLAEKVRSRHGEHRPALGKMEGHVRELCEEMTTHMMKEEAVLFPYIQRTERATQEGTALPSPQFGTVANPVRVMMLEHDSAGELLKNLRVLADDYTPPQGACPTYKAYFQALREFEHDIHRHVHLENNLLFPRALEVEEKGRQAR
jgi:regulator of cell morphogenesis and NO signaling